jgi:hypothetical protein
MNNPDHISSSLETIFWVKILKFFDADRGSGMEICGSGMEKNRIRDKHPGSATLVKGQHVYKCFAAGMTWREHGSTTSNISCSMRR